MNTTNAMTMTDAITVYFNRLFSGFTPRQVVVHSPKSLRIVVNV